MALPEAARAADHHAPGSTLKFDPVTVIGLPTGRCNLSPTCKSRVVPSSVEATARAAVFPAPLRWRDELAFVIKAARPGFWLTAMWFYLLPLAGRPVLDSVDFWFGLVFVAFPFGLFIYGWNDVADAEDDRFNRRKGNYLFGARGTAAQLRRLPSIILAVHGGCAAFMTWRYGPRILWWYLALGVATALYNLPRFGFKGRPVLDLLNQAGYLLVFQVATLINDVPGAHWTTMVFGVSFAMHSHLLGEILDLEPDRCAGRRTTALLLGAVRSKFLLSAFLIWEAWFVWNFFDQRAVAGALGAGAAWFVLDATALFGSRNYPGWLARFFLVGWNVVALVTAPWVWGHAPFSGRDASTHNGRHLVPSQPELFQQQPQLLESRGVGRLDHVGVGPEQIRLVHVHLRRGRGQHEDDGRLEP